MVHLHRVIMRNRHYLPQIGPSLGIMIIEGKHSELGQGIFVSDIQEGSNAEKVKIIIKKKKKEGADKTIETWPSIHNFPTVIFISMQAGLLIGEMILAVNKDLLIDCNYDAVSR